MKLESIHNVYFIGIGGIGMSALARWFKSNGYDVAGYDKNATHLTNTLESEGIAITYRDSVTAIPERFKNNDNTLIVYTPAVPKEHEGLVWFQSNGFSVIKRAQVLGVLTQHLPTIGIAGTHGKTTTSSLTAHLFKQAGKEISAFLGGITTNYQTNVLIGDTLKDGHWVVVEADEYDRSFWQLSPQIAVVNNMDPDHLDIYGDEQTFQEAFQTYAEKIQPGGTLIVRSDVPLKQPPQVNQMITFGEKEGADVQIIDIRPDAGGMLFSLDTEEARWNDLRIELPGKHNVYNATAAFLAAQAAGLTITEIRSGLKSFAGVKRRFEYHYKSDNLVYIDDYAHHPTELEALIEAARNAYPGRKLTLLFQPHLFSRTKDFMDEFSAVLSKVDELGLLPIYPARETPIAGVSSEILASKLIHVKNQIVQKNEVLNWLSQQSVEVILTAGAGDIDQLCQPIQEWCQQNG
ncbi:MAG: UDP-N-acetylmuramate--L-alanine ligase [Cytophagaceae bacterium]|nr:UDP-N-acetylmuramate--L-alanine ligase [Cytophagaceae bacterium]